ARPQRRVRACGCVRRDAGQSDRACRRRVHGEFEQRPEIRREPAEEEMSDTPQQRVTAAIERIPYARFLGIRAELKGDELTLVMPFSQHLVGNPLLPALHGGVVGALLEVTALTQLAIASKSERFPKTVDIGIDYLRSG